MTSKKGKGKTTMTQGVDILEQLSEVAAAVPAQAEAPAAESTSENTNSNGSYPTIRATYASEAEAPTGLMNAREFAAKLTIKRIQDKILAGETPTPDDTVAEQEVYSAIRAKRNPLSVLVVGGAARLDEASFSEWADRPARGEGRGVEPASQMSDEKLIRLQAKLRAEVNRDKDRLTKLQDKVANRLVLLDKRSTEMDKRGITWEQVDAWESQNKEIGDNDNDNDNE